MASATMGLRRRVPVNNSTTQSSHHSQTSTTATTSTNKRSRSENNNNPSHGNLNSLNETPPSAKKSRGTSALSSNRANNHHHITDSGPSNKRTSANSKLRAKSPQTSSISSAVSSSTSMTLRDTDMNPSFNVLTTPPWSVPTSIPDTVSYAGMSSLGVCVSGGGAGGGGGNSGGVGGVQSSLCNASLAMPPAIPYMATSMATFVGNATNLSKNSSVSYLDISNMTSGSLGNTNTNGINGYGASTCSKTTSVTSAEVKSAVQLPFSGIVPTAANMVFNTSKSLTQNNDNSNGVHLTTIKFQNDTMFMAYQPWVIKTYGDLAKTKTITIKKYARILRTLRGEEVNSAENSKFRFWVKSKGFHIGQPEGYDAKPADRIIGRHAVTNPGLDPPLYVPTQLPHNKALNGAEGTVTPGRVFKKVAIVENFFDIIHAVHVDLEGRPGKHAGQKRTYRTITETYAFLPREAVTRFLLGCTECQRRPRTPSPTNLANQSQNVTVIPTQTTSTPSTTMTPSPLSPTPATAVSAASPIQTSLRPREASNPPETKSLFNYRHQKQQRNSTNVTMTSIEKVEKNKELDIRTKEKKRDRERERAREREMEIEREREREREREKEKEKEREKEKEKEREKEKEKAREKEKERVKDREKEEKYNPLSITNLLKKEPSQNYTSTTENIPESTRRTPDSDRASSRSSVSSKRKRMLPEGRTPSPPPTTPLPRPWSPGLDLKDTPVDYSLPITTMYLKHQQRILAEKNKATAEAATAAAAAAAAAVAAAASAALSTTSGTGITFEDDQRKSPVKEQTDGSIGRDRFSPAAGLIDTNLNLLATIQHLHCQVMLALTERLRPTMIPTSLMLPPTTILPSGFINSDLSITSALAHNQS